MKKHVEEIFAGNQLLAMILRSSFRQPGVHFFTPGDLSQQLAFMRHPAGKLIQPHVHNKVSREVHFTQEVLIILEGVLQVDFYDDGRKYLESRLLRAGDVILLATGGHGFKVIEEVQMFEIKQGPYCGESDKTRFEGVNIELSDKQV